MEVIYTFVTVFNTSRASKFQTTLGQVCQHNKATLTQVAVLKPQDKKCLRISVAKYHYLGKDFFLMSIFHITCFGRCCWFYVVCEQPYIKLLQF
jgi:hypothetical protein